MYNTSKNKKGTPTLRSISKLKDDLDKIFSLFIRLRDADNEGNCKCCTCGKYTIWNKNTDCGHFITRGALATRWEDKNCAAQCKSCNGFKGGEQDIFGKYIDKRWGEGTAEILQIKRHNSFKLDRIWMGEFIRIYTEKVNHLKSIKGL
jgi:hypothetical protein